MDLKKNLITLTTDFGTKDYFSGAMKGVILGINPDARIIDISHEVPSHDIWSAAYLLGAAYEYFPQFTIHLVVVDPGVGSQRKPVLAVTDRHYFIAPDNGVLSFVYADPGFSKVIHLTASHYFREGQGSTFNARDIFAPAAAWLSKGIEAENFGDEITDYVRFNIPCSRKEDNGVSGEIVYMDKFGNAITNVKSADIEELCAQGAQCGIEAGQLTLNEVSPFYSAIKKGETGAVINGSGFLEIFVCQGDARKTCGFKRGDKIFIKKR
ncbi:MAG: SAM hydrolase/SAM-dependent halogenase family protein [Nitrospirota bacterium]